MLETGLSEDGAGQALGWPKVRVSARVKILELPEPAQQMIGSGVIALSAVDQLRAIGKVSSGLLDAVVAFLADGNEWAAERLAREPGWVLDSALRDGAVKVFAAHLSQVGSREIAELRLGKKTEDLYVEAEKFHRQIDRYAYGPPGDPALGRRCRPGSCRRRADREGGCAGRAAPAGPPAIGRRSDRPDR